MKLNMLKTILLVAIFSLVACVTGPQEDREEPDVPQGPGLFTGDKGEFTLSDFFGDEKKDTQNKATSASTSASNVSMPAADEASFAEFENFKAWRRTQQPGSAEYQEYQDWRAFQEYRRNRAQQQTNP